MIPRTISVETPRGLKAWLLRRLDGTICDRSLVSGDPVLDVRQFTWTAELRDRWQAVRDEATACLAAHPSVEPMHSVALVVDGAASAGMAAVCPTTLALLSDMPELERASFALLAPGTHLVPPRGSTKALISCQLALAIPRDGDPRMRIGDRVVRWSEGETLVFDDSMPHELWNDGSTARVVLLLRFRRPLQPKARWLGDLAVRLSRRANGARP